ncbi:heterokaryon incompatibility protein-domain-containing protein [Fusarium avenaceum]|nr:heterokaryon incompatibility protein-domain-containing protein [Fusarium avenaceum]
MSSSSVYASIPLDRPQKEIRLIEILETSPQLRCRLIKVSLSNKPIFCALSYVWGASKDYENVVVNDVSFSVTKSLADALGNIQIHWAQAFPDGDKKDMRFWADALCINQADNMEKGYQVPLMKDIYSSARITFSSLDAISSTSNIPSAIDLIHEISSRLHQRHPKTRAETVAAADILDDLPIHRFHIKVGYESWKSKKHPREASQVNVMNDFSRLQYWERAWIVQELVLSKEVIMYYSASSISLEALTRVANWASELLQESYAPSSLPQSTISQEQHMIATSLNQFKTIRQIHNLRKMYHSVVPKVHELRFLWVWGASFRATNPKDHVYALCSIANLDIQPRYDESVSVADVYIEFCIEQTKSPLYAPLQFLQYAGLSNGDPAKLGIPTWVPNFPDCAEAYGGQLIVCLSHPGRTAKLWKDCIGRVEDISIRDRSLHTTSLPVDCISDMSPILHSKQDLASFLCHIYKMLTDAFVASETPYRKDSHPFLKLASAFYHTRIPGTVWNKLELIRVARLFLYLHLSILASGENKSYKESFGNFSRNICCDLEHYMKVGDLEDQPYFRCFVRNISDKSFEGVDWPRNSLDDLNRFEAKGIRVARTIGNEFAVVPSETTIGDQIVLLAGCHDLPLIRKVEHHHIYVGRVGFGEEIVEKKIDEYKAGRTELEYIELR